MKLARTLWYFIFIFLILFTTFIIDNQECINLIVERKNQTIPVNHEILKFSEDAIIKGDSKHSFNFIKPISDLKYSEVRAVNIQENGELVYSCSLFKVNNEWHKFCYNSEKYLDIEYMNEFSHSELLEVIKSDNPKHNNFIKKVFQFSPDARVLASMDIVKDEYTVVDEDKLFMSYSLVGLRDKEFIFSVYSYVKGGLN